MTHEQDNSPGFFKNIKQPGIAQAIELALSYAQDPHVEVICKFSPTSENPDGTFEHPTTTRIPYLNGRHGVSLKGLIEDMMTAEFVQVRDMRTQEE